MTILRELLTVLGFDFDGRGESRASDAFVSLKAKAVALKAAYDATVGALHGLVVETATAGDLVAKTAKRFGITAEEIQELGFAAERSGVPVAALNTGIRDLQQRSVKAAAGNKTYAAAFRALGVEVKGVNGELKPAPRLLEEVATGFQGVRDAGRRTALAMEVAGESGAQLLPLFLEGASGIRTLREEARSLGFVFSDEAAVASEAMADSLFNLRMAILGVKQRLGLELLPLFKEATDDAVAWLKENKALVDKGLSILASTVIVVVRGLSRLAQFVDKNRRFFIALAGVIGAKLIFQLGLLTKALNLVTVAQLKAALIPLLWLAGLAAIALIIEDIWALLEGRPSALGDLIDWAESKLDPKSHWMLVLVHDLFDGFTKLGRVLHGFIIEIQKGGFVKALKDAFSAAIEFWKAEVIRFARFLADEIGSAIRRLPAPSLLLQETPEEKKRPFFQRDILKGGLRGILGIGAGLGTALEVLPERPAQTEAQARARIRERMAAVSVGGSNVTIQVHAAPGQSESALMADAEARFERASANERRRIARELESRVVQ